MCCVFASGTSFGLTVEISTENPPEQYSESSYISFRSSPGSFFRGEASMAVVVVVA